MNLLKKRSFWEVKANTQVGSWMWRKMLKLKPLAKSFYKVEIGNGRHISFFSLQISLHDTLAPENFKSGPVQRKEAHNCSTSLIHLLEI